MKVNVLKEFTKKNIFLEISNPVTQSWRVYLRCENDHNHAKKKIEKGNTISKPKKCNETLGSLIGGGVAASLSTVDAYGWSIPLGLVLGKGIANADC